MIRHETFVMARKPFAIDLDSVRIDSHKEIDGRFFVSGSCDAVWFRRKDRVTRVCWGPLQLWGHYMPEPVDMTSPKTILSSGFDGRYGGQCSARWDGRNYWGAQEPDLIQIGLNSLKPMLDNFPRVPDGMDGWWSFR